LGIYSDKEEAKTAAKKSFFKDLSISEGETSFVDFHSMSNPCISVVVIFVCFENK
jgi:hypothetical protein